ncbi:hypothetical protein SteCoe_10613 [Stentor coeruleus]|uniref:Uncharacterized protein n=1 Tax=Stentor coeruleus TaxID=5963 RepID=A0A1R2CF38_9CILI|nr:hypothetical protein SteCoe_10613 [Stentor coeruleus]
MDAKNARRSLGYKGVSHGKTPTLIKEIIPELKNVNSTPVHFVFDTEYKNTINNSNLAKLTHNKSESITSNRRKSFFEMMGKPKPPINKKNPSPLGLGMNTQSITLIDLMGNGKYKFLKQTGFMNIYDELKKTKTKKSIIEEKKSLTSRIIKKPDEIKDYKSYGLSTTKNVALSPIADRQPVGNVKQVRIKHIENILSKCQEYVSSEKMKKFKSLPKLDLVNDINKMVIRSEQRKLTDIEIKSIHKEMVKLEESHLNL